MIPVEIDITEPAEGEPQAESIAARREREHHERETSARQAAENHPVIREAQALFGGELSPIEILVNGSPKAGGSHAGKP